MSSQDKFSDITVAAVAEAIETFAPRRLQESYDNTGLQFGIPDTIVTGVLLTVDVTPAVVDEAVDKGCNMIVSHHPLLFRGVKSLTGSTPVERALIKAVTANVAIYSSHTALDSAPGGVSHRMSYMLGLEEVEVLEPHNPESTEGLGCVGNLAEPLTFDRFVALVKSKFGSPVVRCSDPSRYAGDISGIERVALCGGSGGSLISRAIEAGAQVYLTSDTRYHDFLDFSSSIIIADIGHHESESCSKEIFYELITKKFPNFAVKLACSDQNPMVYL